MSPDLDLLIAQIEARSGRSFPEMVSGSVEVVLFGSRASGVHSDGSDVDILCVGPGQCIRSRALDLLWVEPAHLSSRSWLESELAGHVARYGLWLMGDGAWRTKVVASRQAAERKAALLQRRLVTLLRYYSRLDPPHRHRSALNVRRHLMRYELLVAGEPVPPTPFLDARWAESSSQERAQTPWRASRTAGCMGLLDQLLELGDGDGALS